MDTADAKPAGRKKRKQKDKQQQGLQLQSVSM